MSADQENTLLLACGDKRLGAPFLAHMEEVIGKKPYVLLVPGPDAGVMGDPDHEASVIFLAKRFYDLTGFTELVTVVHENCAGCQCDVETHKQNVTGLAKRIAYGIGFEGVHKTYIARRPETDDFDLWEIETVDRESESEVIAA